ncbi:hypothetical protein ACHAP5_009668 [Fusarium lateritium]
MASHIQHLVAVAEADANTILFQVDESYKLIFYESQSPSEGLPRRKYDLNTLYVDDDEIKVNEQLPVIAAVAFQHTDSCHGEPQVRLYYVKHNELSLREVYRLGGKDGEWKHGKSFNLKEYAIAEGSGLTANVFQPNNDPKKFTIKLYYQQSNKDAYADVIYNIVANDEWSTRPNVTKA